VIAGLKADLAPRAVRGPASFGAFQHPADKATVVNVNATLASRHVGPKRVSIFVI
jgi:hypothetical protein